MAFNRQVLQQLHSWWGLISLIMLFLVVSPAHAQGPLPQDLIKEVGFEQKLNEQLPLELSFTHASGQAVQLADYFGDKPVILALGYYECPMLCSFVRNGLFESLRGLDFTVGEEFNVVIVSIDPDETPETAEAKQRVSMMEYERPTSSDAWNFLVGEEAEIKQLADAIGFRYTYDPEIDQYLHPSGIVILTPSGQISRYLYGIDFPARDLRLGLVEAGENKIGTPTDQFLLLCYHYDPAEGEYTLFVMNIVRLVGFLSVVAIGGLVYFLFRREPDKASNVPAQ